MSRWVNLEKVALLTLDESVHGCKILSQICRGFGIRNVRACTSVEEARSALTTAPFDLMIADPGANGDGVELIRWLRRQEQHPNRFIPIILVSGHSTPSSVRHARDSGANFFVAKPLTPATLLDRILWVSRDKRPYVEVGKYLGPDRRFKVEEPPTGNGRRNNDSANDQEDSESAA